MWFKDGNRRFVWVFGGLVDRAGKAIADEGVPQIAESSRARRPESLPALHRIWGPVEAVFEVARFSKKISIEPGRNIDLGTLVIKSYNAR
jgi:hypothetical protein